MVDLLSRYEMHKKPVLRPPALNGSVGEGLKPLLYDKIILKETPTPGKTATSFLDRHGDGLR
jgi:hypothetical protein